jgi:glycerophosphoryl diester phosphodiesterase
MAVTTTNLGVITAYGDAVAAGYTGTKAEWQALMASYATVAEEANDAKDDAVAAKNTAVAKATEATTAAATANTAKDTATSKATEATTAANTATTKANEASASAQSIAQSAAQIQENTDSIDQLKSEISAINENQIYTVIDTLAAEGSYFYNITIAKGYLCKITNTSTVSMTVNARNSAGTEVNITNALLANHSMEFAMPLECAVIRTYVAGTNVSYTVEVKAPILNKVNSLQMESIKASKWEYLGLGLFTENNGTYTIYNASSYRLWGHRIAGGETLNISTIIAPFNSLRRVHVVALNQELSIDTIGMFKSDMVVSATEVETSRTTPNGNKYIANYQLTVPNDAKYIIVVNFLDASIPYIKEYPEKRNFALDYDDLLYFAILRGLNASEGIGNGTFCVDLYHQKDVPWIIRCNVEGTGNSPYFIYEGNITYNNNIRYTTKIDNKFNNLEYRIPALSVFGNDVYSITIGIPANTKINNVCILPEYSLQRKPYNTGLILESHLGFSYGAPENTMPAFIASVRSGYASIITNPKLTADGKWVCIHDATINRTGRNLDGSAISETLNVADLTLAELQAYDFGIWKNEVYAGTKICTLDDFLEICAVNGIAPTFSIHASMTSAEIQSLYNIVKKHGLVQYLSIKLPGVSDIESFYSVFGNIRMYARVQSEYSQSTVDGLVNCSAFGKVPLMIDYPSTAISAEVAQKMIEAGLIIGAYDLQAALFARYRELKELGVTLFADDNYCVSGLNW